MGGFEMMDVGGKAVRTYLSGEITPGAKGVVVLHAWWGLNSDVLAYADMLGAAGFAVSCPGHVRWPGWRRRSTKGGEPGPSGSAEAPDTDPPVESIALAAVDDLATRLGPASRLGSPRLLVRCGVRHADPGRARAARGVGRLLRRLHGATHRAVVRRGPRPLRGERPIRERRRDRRAGR